MPVPFGAGIFVMIGVFFTIAEKQTAGITCIYFYN